jgi:Mg2+/Co2+ transporter CorB
VAAVAVALGGLLRLVLERPNTVEARGEVAALPPDRLAAVVGLLGLEFPLDGPRTLNGLIVEHLQDIPEVGVGVRVGGVPMEIVQTQDRKVKMVRLHRPAGA